MHNRFYCYIALFAVCILAGGCATIEDFRAMPPSERADYVCERHPQVSDLSSQLSSIDAHITDIEHALSTGYRYHSFCKQVPVVEESEEVCEDEIRSPTLTVKKCKTKSSIHHKTVCEETPVVIDRTLERENLREYRREASDLNSRYNREFNICHTKVRKMTAAEAFEYHEASSRGLIF